MKRLAKPQIVVALSLLMVLGFASCVPLVIGAVGGAVGGAIESAEAAKSNQYGPATYTGTILSNIIYFPAKVLFAAGGALTTGVAYVVTFGDRAASAEIWKKSVGGDYLLSPAMIAGDETVHFVG
jgi:hypothetical protein